jgi:hypothetical protein
MSALKIALLGPPVVEHRDHRLTFPDRKVLALLAYLAAEGGMQERQKLTRLAAAFLDWVKAQGAEVLAGRALHTSQRLSYQPLIEVLRTRLAQEHDLRQWLGDP